MKGNEKLEIGSHETWSVMRERVRNFIELCGVESRFVCIDEHGRPKSALIGDATTQPLSELGGI